MNRCLSCRSIICGMSNGMQHCDLFVLLYGRVASMRMCRSIICGMNFGVCLVASSYAACKLVCNIAILLCYSMDIAWMSAEDQTSVLNLGGAEWLGHQRLHTMVPTSSISICTSHCIFDSDSHLVPLDW